jgi:hypothetical protein
MKLFLLPALLVAAGIFPSALWADDKTANPLPVRPGPPAAASASTPATTPKPLLRQPSAPATTSRSEALMGSESKNSRFAERIH